MKKLKQIILTQHEWNDAMKLPTPHRNKKKYYRKEKHRAAWKSGSSSLYLHSK
jgi:hypothetical protein